jgi:hypothetical protein
MSNLSDFNNIEQKLFYHHEKLKELSIKHNGNTSWGLEGNVFTYNGINTADFMKIKMQNIFYLAKECKGDVLEIGFNAGNSALIFLMANPNCKLYAIDLCCHSYVKDCVDYLNKNFNNRVTLFEGNSLQIIPEFDTELCKNIFIYHIDGWHAEEGIRKDLKNCFSLYENNAMKNKDKNENENENENENVYVIVDDTHIPCIKYEYEKYVINKKIIDCPDKLLTVPPHYEHKIGKFKN